MGRPQPASRPRVAPPPPASRHTGAPTRAAAALPTPLCRRSSARPGARRGAAQPARAAYVQIGHTDKAHESMSGSSSAYRSGGPQKKLPIAYSPEWMALREHTKEIEKL